MRVRFGRFVFDSETRELLRGHAPVRLSPKAFELLSLLVAHRPKAMSKSDLQDHLWPGTFVVEKNLSNLIGEIRGAIDDDSSNPQFIRTVPRFGYAFREASAGTGASRRTTRAPAFSCVLKWAGGRVRLEEGEYVLGRDPDAEILLDSPGVSRRHARITIAAGQAAIEDLGSKNGTCVGGRRVTGVAPLADGVSIAVGSVTLTFTVLPTSPTTETQSHTTVRK
jgi:DNA-binding winged helix-turn-helix (wHTH) protein